MNHKSVRWNWTPLRSLSIAWLVTLAATVDIGVALEQAIARVNDLLQKDIPTGRFVTAAVGVLRLAENEMTLISAGHGPLLFYRAATGSVELWIADGLPLGIAPSVKFEAARRVSFEPSDALVLITDGFFEWANNQGEQYGITRLKAFVEANGHEPPSMFIKRLHEDVIAHAGGAVQPDDLTVVIVKRCAEAPCLASSSSAKEERVAWNTPVPDVERNGQSLIRS